jgi:hypothetical protein
MRSLGKVVPTLLSEDFFGKFRSRCGKTQNLQETIPVVPNVSGKPSPIGLQIPAAARPARFGSELASAGVSDTVFEMT